MLPFLILQHHPIETSGVFAEMLGERGLATQTVRLDLAQPVPADPSAFAGVIAMGGPMGVYEEERYPWLREEDRLLKEALARDQPTLGICLGSQLIAKAAGARVTPGPEKEIGWYPLTLTADAKADPLFAGFPPTFEAFEWHGDVFDLPEKAVPLAASARYPHQAFRVGRRVYGLLFHLEVTAPMVRVMTDTFKDEVVALGDPSRENAILSNLDYRTPALNALARRLFSAFLSLL
jgi:GMP synthase (glutamine-hydrolysing)